MTSQRAPAVCGRRTSPALPVGMRRDVERALLEPSSERSDAPRRVHPHPIPDRDRAACRRIPAVAGAAHPAARSAAEQRADPDRQDLAVDRVAGRGVDELALAGDTRAIARRERARRRAPERALAGGGDDPEPVRARDEGAARGAPAVPLGHADLSERPEEVLAEPVGHLRAELLVDPMHPRAAAHDEPVVRGEPRRRAPEDDGPHRAAVPMRLREPDEGRRAPCLGHGDQTAREQRPDRLFAQRTLELRLQSLLGLFHRVRVVVEQLAPGELAALVHLAVEQEARAELLEHLGRSRGAAHIAGTHRERRCARDRSAEAIELFRQPLRGVHALAIGAALEQARANRGRQCSVQRVERNALTERAPEQHAAGAGRRPRATHAQADRRIQREPRPRERDQHPLGPRDERRPARARRASGVPEPERHRRSGPDRLSGFSRERALHRACQLTARDRAGGRRRSSSSASAEPDRRTRGTRARRGPPTRWPPQSRAPGASTSMHAPPPRWAAAAGAAGVRAPPTSREERTHPAPFARCSAPRALRQRLGVRRAEVDALQTLRAVPLPLHAGRRELGPSLWTHHLHREPTPAAAPDRAIGLHEPCSLSDRYRAGWPTHSRARPSRPT